MHEKLLARFLNVMDSIEKVFRDNAALAKAIVERIEVQLDRLKKTFGEDTKIKIMNFCGTHEWTVTHFGIRSIVPKSIELVAGPGCPVCVTPSYFIEEAIKLSFEGVVVYTYGDTYRLRTVKPIKGVSSLSEARAHGGSVKVVASIVDAINDAKTHGKSSTFIGIGFETVASGYAKAILGGIIPHNLKFLSLVKLTPPAMYYTIEVHKGINPVRGIIAPGHVSTIVGAKAWKKVAEDFSIPIVVSGFEPIDVLISIYEILKQLNRGDASVVIEYTRAVTWDGDKIAQRMMSETFEVVDDVWRGIGVIPKSGLRLKEKYRLLDAFEEYGIRDITAATWSYDLVPGCRCSDIILGKATPTQCPLFGKICTPSRPVGPCMVSLEGTCAIWARFGGGDLVLSVARDLGLDIEDR